jgi:hypothetical protein
VGWPSCLELLPGVSSSTYQRPLRMVLPSRRECSRSRIRWAFGAALTLWTCRSAAPEVVRTRSRSTRAPAGTVTAIRTPAPVSAARVTADAIVTSVTCGTGAAIAAGAATAAASAAPPTVATPDGGDCHTALVAMTRKYQVCRVIVPMVGREGNDRGIAGRAAPP